MTNRVSDGSGTSLRAKKTSRSLWKTKQICSFTSGAIYFVFKKFKNDIEWFLQLLPVVPRALLHRCLPSQTKKKTFKHAPD